MSTIGGGASVKTAKGLAFASIHTRGADAKNALYAISANLHAWSCPTAAREHTHGKKSLAVKGL